MAIQKQSNCGAAAGKEEKQNKNLPFVLLKAMILLIVFNMFESY